MQRVAKSTVGQCGPFSDIRATRSPGLRPSSSSALARRRTRSTSSAVEIGWNVPAALVRRQSDLLKVATLRKSSDRVVTGIESLRGVVRVGIVSEARRARGGGGGGWEN